MGHEGLLSGKRAFVTGAGQGIGLAIARTYAGAGARVVVADVDAGRADEAARVIAKEESAVAFSVACDVTSEASVEEAVGWTVGHLGALDVVVNNAGVVRDGSMSRLTLADFRAVLDVTLIGSWLVTRAASRHMAPGGGSVVNMSSIAGKVGNPGQTNYSAAKAGIVGLTKASAKELAHKSIRVNAIMPGLIETPMTLAMPGEVWESKLSEIPMGRAGRPEEVADAALFLASDLSSYLTGVVVEVAGGRHV